MKINKIENDNGKISMKIKVKIGEIKTHLKIANMCLKLVRFFSFVFISVYFLPILSYFY